MFPSPSSPSTGSDRPPTAGHWELAGVVAANAPPSYPDGLPGPLLARAQSAIGTAVICNRSYNGIAAIEDYGAEHLARGRPILYTSVDSVVQLAAHTSVMDVPALYAACEALRRELSGPDAVGRVIARPFEGRPGAFERTLGRRDYALAPPGPSHLDALRAAGVEVHGVGKAAALFDGRGFSDVHAGADNAQAIESVARLIGELEAGCVFANLIETDQIYGHRKDAAGSQPWSAVTISRSSCPRRPSHAPSAASKRASAAANPAASLRCP